MWVYFFLFFLVILISAKDFIKMPVLTQNTLGIVLLLILISFFGFRYNCDNDYSNYIGIYESTPLLNEGIGLVLGYGVIVGVEVGYIFVSALFKQVSFNPQSIFIFSSIVTFCITYKVFKRYSVFPTISILIFFSQFFSLPFVQIRFGIAMAIVLLACFYLLKEQRLKYWLLIILATTFHISALGGAVVYFFYNVDWLKRKVLLWTVLTLSFFVMLLPLKNILVSIMGSIGIEKYSKLYADTDSANPISNIISLIILVPLILFDKQLSFKQVPVKILLSMALSSICVGSIVWQLGILNRFSMITAVSFCLIIPAYLLLLKTRKDLLVGCIFIVIYCFLKFLPSMNHVTSYQLFFYHQ